ncbi:MAG: hypothetical protein R3B70_49370, partial [Polyangiaceae bacterium]
FRLYLAVAGAVAVAGGSQVVVQAFAHHAAPELGISTCNEGLGRLAAAVERARVAASGTDGEDAALEHFREALRPDWDDRDHIEDLCRSSPSSLAALDAIERLRYAEEHAARREAAELAPLRRRVQALAPEWAPSAAGTGAPAPPRPTDSSRTERPSP